MSATPNAASRPFNGGKGVGGIDTRKEPLRSLEDAAPFRRDYRDDFLGAALGPVEQEVAVLGLLLRSRLFSMSTNDLARVT